MENITEAFGDFASYVCNWETWIAAPWSCWSWPVVRKTGGMWYSTTRAGWCGADDADPRQCTWDARIEKVVNKSCSDASACIALVDPSSQNVTSPSRHTGRPLHPFASRRSHL